jgi:hypothetical protein
MAQIDLIFGRYATGKFGILILFCPDPTPINTDGGIHRVGGTGAV